MGITVGKETLTFRTESEKRQALDEIARGLDRDRSWVLNAAIDAYLDVHAWQVARIKEGLRQAEAGEFATDEEVARAFRR